MENTYHTFPLVRQVELRRDAANLLWLWILQCPHCHADVVEQVTELFFGRQERVSEGVFTIAGMRCDECGRWSATSFSDDTNKAVLEKLKRIRERRDAHGIE